MSKKKGVSLFRSALANISDAGTLDMCVVITDTGDMLMGVRKYSEHRRGEREMMIHTQLQGRDIHDERVLDAMRRVPRELFVPERLASQAYDDGPLPVGAGQTISQPYIVALMTQELGVRPGDSILEIGTGSADEAHLNPREYNTHI